MSAFRKKPVVIEAFRWHGRESAFALGEWMSEHKIDRAYIPPNSVIGDSVQIVTLEGTMTASPGDWILRGVKGEVYPCRHDIFEATYEPVYSLRDVKG